MSFMLGSACMRIFVGVVVVVTVSTAVVVMISASRGDAALRTKLLDWLYLGGDVDYRFIPRGTSIVCCLGLQFLCF